MIWLQSSGRMITRDVHEPDFSDQEAEISEFLSGEGIGDLDYDDDDDISIGIGED